MGDPARPIRFELSEIDGGCHVKLTASIPDDEVVARSCAGWESHLTMMEAAAAEVPIKFPFDRFKACRADYERQVEQLVLSEINPVRL